MDADQKIRAIRFIRGSFSSPDPARKAGGIRIREDCDFAGVPVCIEALQPNLCYVYIDFTDANWLRAWQQPCNPRSRPVTSIGSHHSCVPDLSTLYLEGLQ